MPESFLEQLVNRGDGFSIHFKQKLSDFLSPEVDLDEHKKTHPITVFDTHRDTQQEDFINLKLCKVDLSGTTFEDLVINTRNVSHLQLITNFMNRNKRFPKCVWFVGHPFHFTHFRKIKKNETPTDYATRLRDINNAGHAYALHPSEIEIRENFLDCVKAGNCLESVVLCGASDVPRNYVDHVPTETRNAFLGLLEKCASTIKLLSFNEVIVPQLKFGLEQTEYNFENLKIEEIEFITIRDFQFSRFGELGGNQCRFFRGVLFDDQPLGVRSPMFQMNFGFRLDHLKKVWFKECPYVNTSHVRDLERRGIEVVHDLGE